MITVTPSPVPRAIQMWQVQTLLATMPSISGKANLLADAQAAIATLPTTDPLVYFWNAPSQPIPRTSSTMIDLAAMLGVTTPAALDAFFVNAKAIAIS